VAEVPVVQTPTLVRKTSRTITFEWIPVKDLSDLEITYDIYIQVSGEEPQQLATTEFSRYTARNLVPGDYKLKVRAFTECAFSEFSEELDVRIALLPVTMSAPTA
jgi:hypothetical protein